ncbi:hypothetical protein QWZ13_09590 [Reinekea marina]|uniref:hypothetical protein n=1 Tax=Reinekea marina TaxID=1310421 RepID=UPI0025B42AC7|nr:hypothetical protein [Reinekea marina]MDN3649162.1 hypothetical protein [Reinekea marina]
MAAKSLRNTQLAPSTKQIPKRISSSLIYRTKLPVCMANYWRKTSINPAIKKPKSAGT